MNNSHIADIQRGGPLTAFVDFKGTFEEILVRYPLGSDLVYFDMANQWTGKVANVKTVAENVQRVFWRAI